MKKCIWEMKIEIIIGGYMNGIMEIKSPAVLMELVCIYLMVYQKLFVNLIDIFDPVKCLVPIMN